MALSEPAIQTNERLAHLTPNERSASAALVARLRERYLREVGAIEQ